MADNAVCVNFVCLNDQSLQVENLHLASCLFLSLTMAKSFLSPRLYSDLLEDDLVCAIIIDVHYTACLLLN